MQSNTFLLFAVFAGMLFVTRIGLPLGLSLILGGIAMDAIGSKALSTVGTDLFHALTGAEVWLLMLTTALLLEYGRFLNEERNASAVVAAAESWSGRHGRAMSLILLPAAIGLVPMPGGALVSAPLVDQAARGGSWSPAWKSAVNYWFRHVWEYWWPIFPVVVVTLSIFHMPTWQYMLTLIPFTIVSFSAGYVFLVRPHRDELSQPVERTTGDPQRLRRLVASLGVVVVVALLLPPVLESAALVSGQQGKLVAMVIGLVAGLVVLWIDPSQRGGTRLFAELGSARSLQQIGTMGGVMVFQALLDSSARLPLAGDEMMASGIPLPCVVALLPLMAGIITGIAAGFAGMAFPLIVGLMEITGSNLTPLATLALAFGFGYAGMMLSPVHLCLVLTRNYFDASLLAIYRLILPCVAGLLLSAAGLFVVLRHLGL